MTFRRVSRFLVSSWGLSRCGGAWAHSPLPPPAHRRNPWPEWLPRLGCQQHHLETAGSTPRVAVVRVRAERCLGGPRRESPTPKWTGNGTQITYANPRSCGPIFLKYANKSDRLRAGFDRDRKSTRLNSSHLGISY